VELDEDHPSPQSEGAMHNFADYKPLFYLFSVVYFTTIERWGKLKN
jgi:hypothetical protein